MSASPQERPLAAFGGLMGTYVALTGGLGAAAVRRGLPDRLAAGDLALLSVATAKLSRLLSRDRVTAALRAPVVEADEDGEESPAGHGLQQALGELVTCPWCLAQWVGTGMFAAFLLRPKETRVVAGLLTVIAANDAVQVAHQRVMTPG